MKSITKSATEGQFRELFAKLLTGVDYKKIDFWEIQKLIKSPELTASMFTNFVNNTMQLAFQNLVISTGRGGDEKVQTTPLQKGDSLVFYYKDGTVSVYRESLDMRYSVYFKRANIDNKQLTNLTTLEEILGACSMLAQSMNCKAVWHRKDMIEKDMIFVKLV